MCSTANDDDEHGHDETNKYPHCKKYLQSQSCRIANSEGHEKKLTNSVNIGVRLVTSSFPRIGTDYIKDNLHVSKNGKLMMSGKGRDKTYRGNRCSIRGTGHFSNASYRRIFVNSVRIDKVRHH